jgi:hypothetical protein
VLHDARIDVPSKLSSALTSPVPVQQLVDLIKKLDCYPPADRRDAAVLYVGSMGAAAAHSPELPDYLAIHWMPVKTLLHKECFPPSQLVCYCNVSLKRLRAGLLNFGHWTDSRGVAPAEFCPLCRSSRFQVVQLFSN